MGTAVIVESSLAQASQDKEAEKLYKAQLIAKMIPKFRKIFSDLDKVGDGELTLEDFGECEPATRRELCELFDTEDIVELFEILDTDGGGAVSIDEFCDEMVKQMSIIRQTAVEHSGCLGEMMKLVHGLLEKS